MSVDENLADITTGRAASYLGVSQSTIINYIDRGWLVPDIVMPSNNGKVGRRKFRKSTLDAFREEYLNVKES